MIAIIDYGMGNLRSVQKALEAVGHAAEVTGDPERVRRADKVILPGVGAFADAIAELRRTGLGEAFRDAVRAGRPALGVAVGNGRGARRNGGARRGCHDRAPERKRGGKRKEPGTYPSILPRRRGGREGQLLQVPFRVASRVPGSDERSGR